MCTQQQSFEQAMEQLGDITKKMQDPDVSLEDSLKYYESGIKLANFCQKKLAQVEQKIQTLNSNNELEEFNTDGL